MLPLATLLSNVGALSDKRAKARSRLSQARQTPDRQSRSDLSYFLARRERGEFTAVTPSEIDRLPLTIRQKSILSTVYQSTRNFRFACMQATLAKWATWLGCSERTAWADLRNLSERGLLETLPTFEPGSFVGRGGEHLKNRQTANCYRLPVSLATALRESADRYASRRSETRARLTGKIKDRNCDDPNKNNITESQIDSPILPDSELLDNGTLLEIQLMDKEIASVCLRALNRSLSP